MLVRPNSVIPFGQQADRPDYDYGEGVTLHVYQLEAGKRVQVDVPTPAGKIETTFVIRREGHFLHVNRQGPPKPWKVLLVGITAAVVGEGVRLEERPEGVVIVPGAEVDHLEVNVRSGD